MKGGVELRLEFQEAKTMSKKEKKGVIPWSRRERGELLYEKARVSTVEVDSSIYRTPM
jgi:hypothetical protein